MGTPIMAQPPDTPGLQLPAAAILSGAAPDPNQGPVITPPQPPQTTIQPVQQDVNVTAPPVQSLAMEHPDLAAAAVHHSRLAAIGNVIGNMLAGPTTPHLIQNPDGTVIVQQQPSTTGEKWSRIAAAALLGASKGFAAGGGPLGAGHALGAGLQQGEAIQPTQEGYEQSAANQQNQDLTTQANVAMLNQRMAIGQLQLAQSGMQLDKAFVDSQQDLQNFISAHDGNIQHTHVDNEDQVRTWLQSHGMNAATDQDYRVVGTYSADRKSTGFDIYQADKNWDERRATAHTIDNPTIAFDSKGNPYVNTDNPISVPDRGQTNLKMWQAKTAAALQYLSLQEKVQQIKTQQATAAHTQEETTGVLPAQVANIKSQTALNYAKATAQNALANDPSIAGIGQDLYEGRVDISQLRARKDWPQIYGAARNYAIANDLPAFNPTQANSRFRAYQDAVRDYSASGDTGKQINSFSTLLEHIGELVDNANALQQTGSPYLNKPINELERDVAGGTAQGPAEIRTAVPAREFENVLANNRALNNDEKAAAGKLLNMNMTPAQQRENSKQLVNTAIDRLAPIFNSYRSTTRGEESPTGLTPGAIRTLHLLGLYDRAAQQLGAAPLGGQPAPGPTPGPGPNTNPATANLPTAPPAGATVRVQIPGSPPGTIPAAGLAQFQRDHPNAQVLR